MGLQLVQLRCRPAMRWPTGSRLGATTAGAEKAANPHRHSTEQRCDLMRPPVLDVTAPAADPHGRGLAQLPPLAGPAPEAALPRAGSVPNLQCHEGCWTD